MDDKPEAENDGASVDVSAPPEKEAAKRPSMAELYARAGARMAAAEAGKQVDNPNLKTEKEGAR